MFGVLVDCACISCAKVPRYRIEWACMPKGVSLSVPQIYLLEDKSACWEYTGHMCLHTRRQRALGILLVCDTSSKAAK